MSLVRRTTAATPPPRSTRSRSPRSPLTAVLGVAVTATALVAGLLAVQSAQAGAAEPRERRADARVEAFRGARPAAAPARLVLRGQAARRAERARERAAAKLAGGQPVLSYRGVADPSVVRYPGGWLAVATGPAAPRAVAPSPGGPWTNIPSALTVLPTWAVSGRIWASDLVQVGGTWILYFSAEVAGLGLDGRCIGTATATDPTATFVPDETPLVCPKQAAAPAAYDKIKRRGKGMPKQGVIDPEYYQDKGGAQYLMYRTQGIPSSIRIVPLPGSGRADGSHPRSTEMVRSNDVIENPTMLRKGRQYVLITSEGYFGDCTYDTTYRKSVKLLDWSKSKRQVLMDHAKTGLCGPGGADLGRGAANERMLFFHAWTCPSVGNCPPGTNYDKTSALDARRSLFAASLRFTKSKSPRLKAYVTPILPPPPPPPTPTPSPTTTTTAPTL